MGILVDAIYRYFANDKVPLSTMVKLTILALLALILIDNHHGFSHTVIGSYNPISIRLHYLYAAQAAIPARL